MALYESDGGVTGTRSAVDLRSDVMSPPTEEMWDAMRRAEFGWSMTGEDRSVRQVEALGAELLGKEAALFVPTCTMANLLALMTLGERGTQVIVESTAHIVWSEEWGVTYICGLFPRLLQGTYGVPEIDAVEDAMTRSKFSHLPRTSLVCLENSHNNAGGIAVTPEQIGSIAALAHRHGAAVHLDGARLFNTAAALASPVKHLAETVDTVAISLSKGLCAPLGALLCGSRRTIEAARLNARRIGAASIHKSGIFAAAGIVALMTMTDRLIDDNRRAAELARRLAHLPDLHIDMGTVQTNIVLAEITSMLPAGECVGRLARWGVLALERSATSVRFVTHRAIQEAEIARAAEAVAAALAEQVPG